MTNPPDVAVGSLAGQALYVFCVARADALTAIDGVGFDGGRPLQLVPFEGLVAVVSKVSVDDFCGPAAEARLRELAWVGPRACHHEAVVEQVMKSFPIVPARFATLFSSSEGLESWLERHHAAITRTLDFVTGHEEWAVKGTLDKQTVQARLLASAFDRERRTPSSSPGARYMQEQRIRAGIERELDVWLHEVRDLAASELLLHAVEFRERAVVQDACVGDGIGIWNWAFLVARQRLVDFDACVRRMAGQLDEQGLALEASGPWPPYSFCPPLEPETLR